MLHAEEAAGAAAPLSLDSALEERLKSQIELMEQQKNEEIQNLKTSLIAEQQVGSGTEFVQDMIVLVLTVHCLLSQTDTCIYIFSYFFLFFYKHNHCAPLEIFN